MTFPPDSAKVKSMNQAVFNTLHDGYISDIKGQVPGDIVLEIHCQYLRERIHEPGETFFLKIKGCRLFSYLPYKMGGCAGEILDLSIIKEAEPGFISADIFGDKIEIYCDDGKIRTQFRSISIWLNESKEISQTDLESVAKSYWDSKGK